jgi:hypothetical protein
MTPRRILATFPGKFGDLLWALPTIRALSRRMDAPLDLLLAAPLASIASLIEAQDYIGRCVADLDWHTQDTAPISPRVPVEVPTGYDAVYHLGYQGWPHRPLPFEVLDTLHATWPVAWEPLSDSALDLQTPWITLPPAPGPRSGLAVGFTDEHFELKYGLTELIRKRWGAPLQIVGRNPRWVTEARVAGGPWESSVRLLQISQVFLGCCSALHVLAVALGIPAVLMEPNPHRHHPIFYPLGTDGPQVTLVKGIDGLPTFDARHVFDTLKEQL